MGDYWLRDVRPDLTGAFAEGIDIIVAELFQATLGMDVNQWSPAARERIRIPIREGGCGLQEAVDRRFGQFMGGVAQSVPALVTRTSARNITVVGRLNSPAIIELFGEGSFDHPAINPWEALLESTSSPDNLCVVCNSPGAI